MTDTIYAWSKTAADNATADATVNFAENQAPSTVNNSSRALMARIAELIDDLAPTVTSTGSANAYAVASAAAGATLRDGETITFIPNHTNTTACTLNVDARGAKPWRPKAGTSFVADNILSGVPVTAYYSLSGDEWLSPGTGYYVTQLASGVALQSITARLPQIGDMVISFAPSPGAGRIRLTEATQSILKSAYPELNSYLSGISYPWGSTATHFSLPPAAGYALRFAATSASIDTGGARAAGSTQADQNKAHSHTASETSAGDHSHTVPFRYTAGAAGGSFSAYHLEEINGATTETTSTAGAHTHAITVNSDGGAEVRMKNVAFHVDVIASTALAAAQVAVFGFPYQWDTGITNANPGAGRVRGNNATPASITELYIGNTDGWGVDLSALYASLVAAERFNVSKVGAQANRLVFTRGGAPTANSGYYTIPVTTVVAAWGGVSNNDSLALDI